MSRNPSSFGLKWYPFSFDVQLEKYSHGFLSEPRIPKPNPNITKYSKTVKKFRIEHGGENGSKCQVLIFSKLLKNPKSGIKFNVERFPGSRYFEFLGKEISLSFNFNFIILTFSLQKCVIGALFYPFWTGQWASSINFFG